jgi:hypothetical protein
MPFRNEAASLPLSWRTARFGTSELWVKDGRSDVDGAVDAEYGRRRPVRARVMDDEVMAVLPQQASAKGSRREESDSSPVSYCHRVQTTGFRFSTGVATPASIVKLHRTRSLHGLPSRRRTDPTSPRPPSSSFLGADRLLRRARTSAPLIHRRRLLPCLPIRNSFSRMTCSASKRRASSSFSPSSTLPSLAEDPKSAQGWIVDGEEYEGLMEQLDRAGRVILVLGGERFILPSLFPRRS